MLGGALGLDGLFGKRKGKKRKGTGSFQGVKWLECGADHPPPSGPTWPVPGRTLPFTLMNTICKLITF
jgi:hypothetical protein